MSSYARIARVSLSQIGRLGIHRRSPTLVPTSFSLYLRYSTVEIAARYARTSARTINRWSAIRGTSGSLGGRLIANYSAGSERTRASVAQSASEALAGLEIIFFSLPGELRNLRESASDARGEVSTSLDYPDPPRLPVSILSRFHRRAPPSGSINCPVINTCALTRRCLRNKRVSIGRSKRSRLITGCRRPRALRRRDNVTVPVYGTAR